jgi:hypothetical protein
MTVLASGVKWHRDEVEKHLTGAAGVLVVYPADDRPHDAVVARHGEGAVAGEGYERRRRTLLASEAARVPAELEAEAWDVSGLIEATGRALADGGWRRAGQRQRDGGGGVPGDHRPTAEAERRPLANPSAGADGTIVPPASRRPVRCPSIQGAG